MAFLRLHRGDFPHKVIELSDPRILLGRHSTCTVRFESDVISRHHAQIVESQGKYVLEDLGSNNGTFLNGVALTAPVELREGDQVQLCTYVFTFHSGDGSAPVANPPGAVADLHQPLRDALAEKRTVAEIDHTGWTVPLTTPAEDPSGRKSTAVIRLTADARGLDSRLGKNAEAKLRALQEISRRLCRQLTLDQVFATALEGLASVFPQMDAGAVLLQESSGELVVKASRDSEGRTGIPVAVSRTVARRSLEQSEAILIQDVANDDRFSSSESLHRLPIRSLMCVPLIGADESCRGAVQIETQSEQRRFEETDLDVTVSIAAQVALAIQSARLHDEVRRAQERAQALAAELSHATRVSLVGEMAAGIAHELHQPLSVVVNYASGCERRLRQGSIEPGDLIDSLREINAQALRAGEIVRSIRKFVQKRKVTPESLNLNDVVEDALQLAAFARRRRQARFIFRPSVGLPPASADRVQITQVVLNLIINAIEAMDDRPESERAVTVETRGGDELEVAVTDCGPGVAPEVQEQVFEQFYTTKSEGLGIGLSISRSIVEAHGGRLWVESRPGRGATFRFTLPKAHSGPSPESETVEQ